MGPRKFTVFLTEVRKGHNGGWRWHKWGPYIGHQERSGCEYLDEEPNIESVFLFNIVEHRIPPEELATTP